MPVSTLADAKKIEFHGLTAHPIAVPSRGSSELAIWHLELAARAARRGAHRRPRGGLRRTRPGGCPARSAASPALGPGDALIVPPGVLFGLGNDGEEAAHVLVCTSAGIRATMNGADHRIRPGPVRSATPWNVRARPRSSRHRLQGEKHGHAADAARLLVRCLEAEGVEYVFGIPGEENIHFTDALARLADPLRARPPRAGGVVHGRDVRAAHRAGRGRARRRSGPGAINLLLGVRPTPRPTARRWWRSPRRSASTASTRSRTRSSTWCRCSADHQVGGAGRRPRALSRDGPQGVQDGADRTPGAVYLAVPEDVEAASVAGALAPLKVNVVRPEEPSPAQIARAAAVLGRRGARSSWPATARRGPGGREPAALLRAARACRSRPRSTARACSPTTTERPRRGRLHAPRLRQLRLRRGRRASICVGYELQEFDPVRINPDADKKIIHIHRSPAEVDDHYPVEVGIQGDISHTLRCARRRRAPPLRRSGDTGEKIRRAGREELDAGRGRGRLPALAAPRRHRHPGRHGPRGHRARRHRRGEDVDGAHVPDVRAEHLPGLERPVLDGLLRCPARSPPSSPPDRRVLAATGDGAFLMNSQELETAVRERIPLTILIWEDEAYGLIEWKMDLEMGRSSHIGFANPDFVEVRRELRRRRPPDHLRRRAAPDPAQGPRLGHRLGHRGPGRLLREPPR